MRLYQCSVLGLLVHVHGWFMHLLVSRFGIFWSKRSVFSSQCPFRTRGWWAGSQEKQQKSNFISWEERTPKDFLMLSKEQH